MGVAWAGAVVFRVGVSAGVGAVEHGAWYLGYMVPLRMSHRFVSWCAAFEGFGDLFDAAGCASCIEAGCSGLGFCVGEADRSFCASLAALVCGACFVDAFGFGVHECLRRQWEFVYGVAWVACGLACCEASTTAGHPLVGFFG